MAVTSSCSSQGDASPYGTRQPAEDKQKASCHGKEEEQVIHGSQPGDGWEFVINRQAIGWQSWRAGFYSPYAIGRSDRVGTLLRAQGKPDASVSRATRSPGTPL